MASNSQSQESHDEVIKMKQDALMKAVNELTDQSKLRQCLRDLRLTRICAETWWEIGVLPNFFVVTICNENKTYDMYVNDRVLVAHILHELLYLDLFKSLEQGYACLKSVDGSRTYELDEYLNANLSDNRLVVHKRNNLRRTMQIFLKGLSGETLILEVDPDTTIDYVKLQTLICTGVDPKKQRLNFAGKGLESGHTLRDYNIQIESTLHLTVPLVGGKPVIRLHSSNDKIIPNVSVRLDLDKQIWHLSNIYPTSSNTDSSSFIEWNHIQVYPDGRLFLEKKQHAAIETNRLYPSIDDDNEHRMLFWEALTHDYSPLFSLNHGLCVPRQDFPRILNHLLRKMSFTVEDRDDMITYVIPQLNDVDPEYRSANVRFRFLSSDEYSSVAQLNIRPLPERIVRAFLLFGLSDGEEAVSTMDEIDKTIDLLNQCSPSLNGLIVHEWGSMFIP